MRNAIIKVINLYANLNFQIEKKGKIISLIPVTLVHYGEAINN